MARRSVPTKRGIVLDPDEPIWDVRHLDALIALWLQHCYSTALASTVDGYADQIAHFRRWLAQNGPAMRWEMRRADMQRFVNCLEGVAAYNTRRVIVTRLRSMLRWANETGRTEGIDYRSWVPTPKGSQPVRVAAPILDLIALMESTGRSAQPYRNRALLAVMLGAGLRRGEASGLNVDDVEIHADGSGTLIVRKAKVVEHRDQQWRVVAFDGSTGRYIRAHLDELDRTSGPLFTVARGRRRMTPNRLYAIVKDLIVSAGLSDKIQGPHDLRRNFTTYFARQRRGEVNGQLISKQLGHSSFSMTTRYNLMDAEDLREIIVSPFALMEK